MHRLLLGSAPSSIITTRSLLRCYRIPLQYVHPRLQILSRASQQPQQSSTEEYPPSTSDPQSESQMPFGAIASLAGVGALETLYLTLSKPNDVLCSSAGPVSGCASVLSSEWASFFGLPLSLLGCMAYTTVSTLAAVGASRRVAGVDERDDSTTRAIRAVLLGGGIVLATSSAFLMYVLFSQFPGELCPYCIASATLSAAILYATLRGYTHTELTSAAVPATTLIGTAALVLTLNFSAISSNASGYVEVPYEEPPVSSTSAPEAVALAKRLRDAGARMYGAFWCSHCFDQKQAFGKEAMAFFPYVECYPDGFRKGVELAPACAAVDGLKGFPTWVIGGRTLEGEQSFEVLAAELARVESSIAAPSLVD